eukprot:gene23082-biopygen4289
MRARPAWCRWGRAAASLIAYHTDTGCAGVHAAGKVPRDLPQLQGAVTGLPRTGSQCAAARPSTVLLAGHGDAGGPQVNAHGRRCCGNSCGQCFGNSAHLRTPILVYLVCRLGGGYHFVLVLRAAACFVGSLSLCCPGKCIFFGPLRQAGRTAGTPGRSLPFSSSHRVGRVCESPATTASAGVGELTPELSARI